MQSLMKLYPKKYSFRENRYDKNNICNIFLAQFPEDYDLLEDCILKYNYYNQPNCWSLVMDDDKRLMAEMMSCFNSRCVLELGCSVGAIMKCLKDRGIYCEGIEISKMAIKKAFPEIKEQIHFGDLLELNLRKEYDLIFGLDIFEHFNPNKINKYLKEIHDLLMPGGFVFVGSSLFHVGKLNLSFPVLR